MNLDFWLSRLLILWLIAFAGLLFFLYMFFVGFEIDGFSMYQLIIQKK